MFNNKFYQRPRKQFVHDPIEFDLIRREIQNHPRRRGHYRIISRSSIEQERSPKVNDWGMVFLLRIMSNVRIQFWNELSNVLWNRVKLFMWFGRTSYSDEDTCNTSPEALSSFLNDRPAVHTGIKSLQVALDYDPDNIANDMEENERRFVAFCSLIAIIELESFTIQMNCDMNFIEQVLQEYPPSLPVLRTLNVIQNFWTRLCVLPIPVEIPMYYDSIDHPVLRECEAQGAKYSPIFTKLFMPDSLRKQIINQTEAKS